MTDEEMCKELLACGVGHDALPDAVSAVKQLAKSAAFGTGDATAVAVAAFKAFHLHP